MIQLDKAVRAWGTPEFASTLKTELEQLDPGEFPLQRGLSSGCYVSAQPITATIISSAEQGKAIRARAGLFYKGIMSGCSCEDDPTTTSESNEYCEVELDIDKATSNATVAFVPLPED